MCFISNNITDGGYWELSLYRIVMMPDSLWRILHCLHVYYLQHLAKNVSIIFISNDSKYHMNYLKCKPPYFLYLCMCFIIISMILTVQNNKNCVSICMINFKYKWLLQGLFRQVFYVPELFLQNCALSEISRLSVISKQNNNHHMLKECSQSSFLKQVPLNILLSNFVELFIYENLQISHDPIDMQDTEFSSFRVLNCLICPHISRTWALWEHRPHYIHITQIPNLESQHGEPDHPKNLINCSLYHCRAILKISSEIFS